MKTLNRFYTTCILTVLSLLLLTACGGGGGGSGGGGGGGPATGTFTKTVVLDGSSSSWQRLFGTNTAVRFQFLYRASEVKGSGNLQSVSFRYNENELAAVTCPHVTLKMGHTSLADLTTTFADNVEEGKGSLVTVLNDAAVSIPTGSAGNYFTITLGTPFNYNGVDNLVVEVVRTAACTDSVASSNSRAATTYGASNISFTQSAPASGTVLTPLADAKFHFAGGDNEQNFGGTGSSSFPFTSITPRTQNLYLASEIDGSGPITGLAFHMSQVSTAETYTATIMMGHSTLASLGTNFAANYSDTPVTVANAVTFNIPAGIPAGEWFWVPLPDATFVYNGTDNFIVDVAVSAGSGVTFLRFVSINGRGVSNSDHTAITGLASNSIIDAKLRFDGGTMDVITGGDLTTGLAFNIEAKGRMNLYHASELGTAATIHSVACRMNQATSAASTFDNYKVIMGHSNLDTLDTMSANNFVSQHVAYDGSFNIPAGLVQGDWITVNLNSPFIYDGTSNLVIWMGTTSASAGATNHNCRVSAFNATRYPGQLGSAAPDAANVTVQDSKFDMRLGISK